MSTLQVLVNIFAFLSFTNLTWNIKVKIGNWLKHKHPNWKILRFFWWSMCDVEGFCEYEIDNIVEEKFLNPQRQEYLNERLKYKSFWEYLKYKLSEKNNA